jgi:hypothetical protein
MNLEAPLIILMAGAEIFRPLRSALDSEIRDDGAVHVSCHSRIAGAPIDAATEYTSRIFDIMLDTMCDQVGLTYPGRRVDANVGLAVLAHLPFAFAVELHARTIDNQTNRAAARYLG